MTDLMALADRVEALTGPCRETDAAIFRAIGAPLPEKAFGLDVELKPEGSGYVVDIGGMLVRYEPAAFTASLDAAMTLTDGLPWPVNVTMATAYGSASVMPCDGKSTGIHDKRGGHCRGADTPALALTAAALRARAAKEPEA